MSSHRTPYRSHLSIVARQSAAAVAALELCTWWERLSQTERLNEWGKLGRDEKAAITRCMNGDE